MCYKIESCLDYNSFNIILLAQYNLCLAGTGTIAAAQYYVRLAGDSGAAIAYYLSCLVCCLMSQTIVEFVVTWSNAYNLHQICIESDIL